MKHTCDGLLTIFRWTCYDASMLFRKCRCSGFVSCVALMGGGRGAKRCIGRAAQLDLLINMCAVFLT